MRAIEDKMLTAIYQCRDWRLANTEVCVVSFPHAERKIERISVILHGNKIAEITPDSITINNCGWESSTTKSRLNALLRGLHVNAGIYQKKHKWFLEINEHTTLMEPGEDYTISR